MFNLNILVELNIAYCSICINTGAALPEDHTLTTSQSSRFKMALRLILLSSCFSAVAYSCVHANVTVQDLLFSGQYEFVDLTFPFDNLTVYWPGVQKFEYTKKTEKFVGNDKPWWYAAYEFRASEHGGTHIDAPYHFYSSGAHVGDIPLDKLIVPLIIVDVSSLVNGDASFVLMKSHVDLIILNDTINMGKPCLVIFKFGWSQFYQTNKYLGWNAQKSTMNFPGISSEVAEWITNVQKHVVGVGVDVSSVDPGTSQEFAAHKILSKAGLYNLENVNLSRPIPETGCTALALPMKVTEGTGSPLRLVAVCPHQPTSV